jgi:hypothetical protein
VTQFFPSPLEGAEPPAPSPRSLNVGHGHVFPRPDGKKTRCGGVGICPECTQQATLKEGAEAEIRGREAEARGRLTAICGVLEDPEAPAKRAWLLDELRAVQALLGG